MTTTAFGCTINPSTTALIYRHDGGERHWVCLVCGTAGMPHHDHTLQTDARYHMSAEGRLIRHWRENHGAVTNGLRIQLMRVS